MDKVAQIIFEDSINGKIDRQTAIKLLNILKTEYKSKKDIAVIGMSARFPSANNISEYWENIISNKNCITELSDERCKLSDCFCFLNPDSSAGLYYKKGGYLEDIDKFDNEFFKLSPKEASLMDPNQRLFLETAWNTIEDAGYIRRISGSKTGVYLGYSDVPYYSQLVNKYLPDAYTISVAGNATPVIASRISYLLDLRGPSMIIDTACSSSLVAINLACESISNGNCDQAIAGGIKLNLFPLYREDGVGIESSDYQVRAFDHYSKGTIWGEGVAAVFLKPLEKAIEDKDNIYAVIKGSSINQDGSSVGLTAPNPDAQEKLYIELWKKSNISPETISYIEAHGTGTELGDPIEIRSIDKAIKKYSNRKQFCAIGTVKTNIGHLDCASGMAGFIKAVLALKNKVIPSSINFSRPNRKIDFTRSAFYLNDIPKYWESNNEPRRGGVSSFGFSGTNCHIVLEEAPEFGNKSLINPQYQIIKISAISKMGIIKIIKNTKDFIEKNPDIDINNLCYTMNTGRDDYKYRLVLVLSDIKSFIGMIDDILNFNEFMKDNKNIFWSEEGLIYKSGNKEEEFDDKYKDNERLYMECKDYRKESLYELCKRYIDGADVQWDKLYQNEERYKISLPGYPFEKKVHWIDLKNDIVNKNPMYHKIKWRKIDNLKSIYEENSQENIVFFKAGNSINHQIADALYRHQCKIIEVDIDNAFSRINSDKYTISNNLNDVFELFNEISCRNITKFVYSVSSGSEFNDENEFSNSIQSVVLTLLNIMKAIDHYSISNIDIIIVTQLAIEVTGKESSIFAINSTLHGISKVISLENLFIKSRCIDIDENSSADQIADEILNKEIISLVAFRGEDRYVCELNEEINRKTNDNILKHNGVYIITGGLGNLGIEISKLLASKGHIKLVIIGQTKLPDKNEWEKILRLGTSHCQYDKIQSLIDIGEHGAQVYYYNADISNKYELEAIINKIHHEYGKIDGIIHCAGIGSGLEGLKITEDSEEIFTKVINPKVKGTWLLDNLTRADNMDFFVVFSSPITLIGGVGSASYTAANTYLDSFVQYRNKLGYKTISMSWAPWRKTVNSSKLKFDISKQLFEVLRTSEALNAFWDALNGSVDTAFVGYLNYKSDVFHMEEFLYFSLAADILDKVNKKENFIENTEIINEKRIQIIGKENNLYTEFEKSIANTYGDVLGYNKISIYDNFYELGGDSVIALKVVNEIYKTKGYSLKISDIFKYPIIHDLAIYIETIYAKISKQVTDIVSAGEKDYYELSFGQKRIFLLDSLDEIGTGWNMTSAFLLNKKPDIMSMENAFNELIKRHSVLKTAIQFRGGKPVQVIENDINFKIDELISDTDNIQEIIERSICRFDLNKAPLLCVKVIKLPNLKYILFVDMHHIISDAISRNILIHEFVELYNGKILNHQPRQYIDYSEWFNECFRNGSMDEQENFWLNQFKENIEDLNLYYDYKNLDQKNNGENLFFEISEDITYKLKDMAKELDVTIFMIFISAYFILLNRYTNQNDITIGLIDTGRVHANFDDVLGTFINYLPVRYHINNNVKCIDLVYEIKELLLLVFQNKDYPYDELIAKLRESGKLVGNQLYKTMFLMQNVPEEHFELDGINIEELEIENKTSKLDFTLEVYKIDRILYFRIEYNTNLFMKETMSSLGEDYITILKTITENKNSIPKNIRLNNNVVMLEKTELDFGLDL